MKKKSFVDQYGDYIKDNPRGLWFKMRLYGWGWVPVRWQGWVVILVALLIFLGSGYVADVDDAPGAAVLGFVVMLGIIFFFGYWKGEKPRWRWGK